MPRRAKSVFLITALALGISGLARAAISGPKPEPAPAAPIVVHDAWARPTPGASRTGAVYLTIENKGRQPDQLKGASAPVAEMASLHAVVMQDDVVRMREAPEVPIPADGTVVFRPGAWHIMLMGLAQPLKEGTTFPMTLTFRKAGRLEVQVAVRKDAPHSFWGERGMNAEGGMLWKEPKGFQN